MWFNFEMVVVYMSIKEVPNCVLATTKLTLIDRPCLPVAAFLSNLPCTGPHWNRNQLQFTQNLNSAAISCHENNMCKFPCWQYPRRKVTSVAAVSTSKCFHVFLTTACRKRRFHRQCKQRVWSEDADWTCALHDPICSKSSFHKIHRENSFLAKNEVHQQVR